MGIRMFNVKARYIITYLTLLRMHFPDRSEFAMSKTKNRFSPQFSNITVFSCIQENFFHPQLHPCNLDNNIREKTKNSHLVKKNYLVIKAVVFKPIFLYFNLCVFTMTPIRPLNIKA